MIQSSSWWIKQKNQLRGDIILKSTYFEYFNLKYLFICVNLDESFLYGSTYQMYHLIFFN